MESIKKVDALYRLVTFTKDEYGEVGFLPHAIPRPVPVYVFNKQAGKICLHDQFFHKYRWMMTYDEAKKLRKRVIKAGKEFGLEVRPEIIKVDLTANGFVFTSYSKIGGDE